MPDFNGFPQRFKEARTNKGLSKAALARAIPVSRQSVDNWEGGIKLPHTKNIPHLAEVLGVTPAWLMFG